MSDPIELTRGERNNNPGNIRLVKGLQWEGEWHCEDPDFCCYGEVKYGVRAIAKILLNYHRKDGVNTIQEICNRWAPPKENDTTSYAHAVSLYTGFGMDDPLNFKNELIIILLVKAIIHQENGRVLASDEDIDAGVELAMS